VYRRSYANIAGPFGVWFEVPGRGGAGNFITGAGGFLQGTLAGYGGVRLLDSTMIVAPRCPPGVNVAQFRGISFAGARFDIRVVRDGTATITLAAVPASGTAQFRLPSAEHDMAIGTPYPIPIAQRTTVTLNGGGV
jgi:hypothetical protein